MKTIILSIKPRWAAKIYSREKRIEFRRVIPKCLLADEEKYLHVLLYESSPISQVTGECVMRLGAIAPDGIFSDDTLKKGCLTEQEMQRYSRGRPVYAMSVSGATKWNAPKNISYYNKRAPMNYMYQLICACGKPYDTGKSPCHVRCTKCTRVVGRLEVDEAGQCDICAWDCTRDD